MGYWFGGLAQLARAREWHSRGRGFNSLILHHLELLALLSFLPIFVANRLAKKLSKCFLALINSNFLWTFKHKDSKQKIISNNMSKEQKFYKELQDVFTGGRAF